MVQNKPSQKRQRRLQLLAAGGPLKLATMDILQPLPKKLNGSQFMLVVTDRYWKLTRAVQMSKMTASHIASLFMDYWEIPYRIPK